MSKWNLLSDSAATSRLGAAEENFEPGSMHKARVLPIGWDAG
jgi:hypothetical protein